MVQSKDGRILILKIGIEDFQFMCQYLCTKRASRELKVLLEQFLGERIIVGCDFNLPLSKNDKEGGRDISFKKCN